MFDNLTVETAERRTRPPRKEAPAEVVALIETAWENQQGAESATGHMVKVGAENVDAFHAVASLAARRREPKLTYRKVARVGEHKDPAYAYFTLAEAPAESSKAK